MKKLYLENEDISIPRATSYRQRKKDTSSDTHDESISTEPAASTSSMNTKYFQVDPSWNRPDHQEDSYDMEVQESGTCILSSDYERDEFEF